MRRIEDHKIASAVERLFLKACCRVDERVLMRLKEEAAREESPFGREILSQLIQNAEMAEMAGRPLCQDTGMAVVFVDWGQEVLLEGDTLEEAVNRGVRAAYDKGYFRKSVLTPLDRKNTGDNTPAIVHLRMVKGDKVRLRAAPKGFGSENMSRLVMLTPSKGIEGVKDAIVETARLAGPNPCPPIILGVGIGGTMEKAAIMAKEALLRPLGEPSDDPVLQEIEQECLERINDLGIGPMGLGGRVTCLGVHCLSYPTHIAGLPVAINTQCHAARHEEVIL
ncbi:fumarate hydratase [Gehongia tenuis]|uniref:Fumarate hydratase n=1 Tax=Gehongia tenuis TaxID=2763655 RepID=A0A926D6F8_9FIRM|nr:fumarate hydratase [Gehongia tenuis]MBC8532121.1 fumarate hydratase [Gehongia tenuis]